MDFLLAAGIVIDFHTASWHFAGGTRTFPLEFERATPAPAAALSVSAMSLRSDEGMSLTSDQRQNLSDLLQRHEDVFRLGGEATCFAEHHIDTGDHASIAVPPYRLTPAKRAAVVAEINKTLTDGVIKECESAWAAPALLVPKREGYMSTIDNSKPFIINTDASNYALGAILIQDLRK